MAASGYLPKLKRGLGLAFGAHFLHDFSIRFILDQPLNNCWQGKKEGKTETQKFEYLENEKSLLDETKNIFNSFWRAVIWWKNKMW